VTLYAVDSVANRRHHFYEVPLPDDFLSNGTRNRELTVALAHTPATRTTRVDYKASRISFKLVQADSLDEIVASFNATTEREDFESIPELPGRSIPERERSRGTAQAATWVFRRISSQRRTRRLFVVVTRLDGGWSAGLVKDLEDYALAVILRDRENLTARLYNQIQARLALRVRPRVRV